MAVHKLDKEAVAASYFTLAMFYFQQRNYKKALELYAKSLDIIVRVRGQGHMDVAAVYNNMSCVYYKQEKYDEALALYNKSLDIFLKVCLLGGLHFEFQSLINHPQSPRPYAESKPRHLHFYLYFNLAQCINQMVLESQLPTKSSTDDLLLLSKNNKLTIVWGELTF